MKTQYRPEAFSPEENKSLFGKGSDSRKANHLMKTNPVAYAEAKQVAVYRDGILPEASLPLTSRLTRQELEEANERLTSGELVTVPLEICSQYGIAPGTKLPQGKIKTLQGKE
jgi:hypothetical protein